jgi:hypothetical protein
MCMSQRRMTVVGLVIGIIATGLFLGVGFKAATMVANGLAVLSSSCSLSRIYTGTKSALLPVRSHHCAPRILNPTSRREERLLMAGRAVI